jgi:hypothetical protein
MSFVVPQRQSLMGEGCISWWRKISHYESWTRLIDFLVCNFHFKGIEIITGKLTSLCWSFILICSPSFNSIFIKLWIQSVYLHNPLNIDFPIIRQLVYEICRFLCNKTSYSRIKLGLLSEIHARDLECGRAGHRITNEVLDKIRLGTRTMKTLLKIE